jgi:uncharacterized protein
MPEPGARDSTLIGSIASVTGGLVRVRLDRAPTTLVLVQGQSYRLGQVGAFVRIPLGYSSLYGVCTQVGSDAAPSPAAAESQSLEQGGGTSLTGFRWMTAALFGESLGGQFERGIGQYPTVGDEVHLVTTRDLDVIYGNLATADAITIGRIASSSGIEARLQLSTLVSRHSCVVGSTGSGKSNLVAVILEELTRGTFPRARVLVIDPHGEYGSTVGERGRVIRSGLGVGDEGHTLRVPYWALPLDELLAMTTGEMQPYVVEAVRDRVRQLKVDAAARLTNPPPLEAITADSPIPFSLRGLWFELQEQEAATYRESGKQDDSTKFAPEDPGDAATLRPARFPPATSTNSAPYYNKNRRSIGRQLDLLRSRLLDANYAFMFRPDDDLSPDLNGDVKADLDVLLTEWIGGAEPVTVLDVSGVPYEVMGTVVGTMLRLIYDALFWAMELSVGGRAQPLLVVLDEAHRLVPKEGNTPSHRAIARIAKEGRKYGVGLMIVTQRPGDIDTAVMSQCGTTIALRVTSTDDRGAVAGAVQDDLAGLTALLPSLRTGECLVLGEALQVPSRVRVRKALQKPVGDDPQLPGAWIDGPRPDPSEYARAVANWRAQSTVGATETKAEG